jgi:hypothetical protein
MVKLATTRIHDSGKITELIHDCCNESHMDKKVQMLFQLNSVLPKIYRINIPSLITDDYIDTVLFQIEKSILSMK